MDSSTVASRLKQTPRFLAIRSPHQLQLRLNRMTPLQIWRAMTQRGIAGWKHKVMSDELERRKCQILAGTDIFPFVKELSA
jgi:hypothetical protein